MMRIILENDGKHIVLATVVENEARYATGQEVEESIPLIDFIFSSLEHYRVALDEEFKKLMKEIRKFKDKNENQ